MNRFLSFIIAVCLFSGLNPLSAQPLQTSNLPIIIIDTDGQDIPDEPKIPAQMGIIWNGPGELNSITDPFNNYDGSIAIEIRGSSAQSFPKKSYGFETRDSFGQTLNVPLIGLPEENDWILYGPYSDKSLLRNFLSLRLARDMGWYSSRTRFCELVVNDDYVGLYILTEKIKRDNNRVDIESLDQDDNDPSEITGGYIIKIDKLEGTDTDGWYSTFPPYEGSFHSIYYQFHYPDPDAITPFQRGYIQNFIYHFENTMDSPDFADPLTGYPSIINTSSFIDYIIINEVTRNVDAYRLSSFLYKNHDDTDGRLTAGPVWDYNLALGNADYYGASEHQGWQYQFDILYDGFQVPFWWRRLMEDPAFENAVSLRWSELRQSLLDISHLYGIIDSTAEEVNDAQVRNFERWPILSQYVWPNNFVGDTYENEILYLKGWIANRILWIDTQWQAVPAPEIKITEINYNSAPFHAAGDWIEIFNPTAEPVDVSGWVIRDEQPEHFYSIDQALTLNPQEYLVICRNMEDFSTFHPECSNVIGEFNFGLSSGSDLIQLYTASGQLVCSVQYDDESPWPPEADGYGLTLELIDDTADQADPSNWRHSNILGGTPGQPNSSVPPWFDIEINEFLAVNDSLFADEFGEFDDWVELTNQSWPGDFNIGGYRITDGSESPWPIPNNPELTAIGHHQFCLLWFDNQPEQGTLHIPARLSGNGEGIFIYDPDGMTLRKSVVFDDQNSNISMGQYPDASGNWQTFTSPTPGFENTIEDLIFGCMDEFAMNYNPLAGYDDGSCLYSGDLSMDGQADVLDIVLLVDIALGYSFPTENQMTVGDLSSDGVLNILDIILLVDLILN